MRERVESTAYSVHAEPVYASPRWRYVITTDGAMGAIVVMSSDGTYSTPEAAKAAGVGAAHTMAKRLREDLAR